MIIFDMKTIAKILTVLFTALSIVCMVVTLYNGNWIMLGLVNIHYLVSVAGANYARSKGRCYWKGFALCWNYPIMAHIIIAFLKVKRVFRR